MSHGNLINAYILICHYWTGSSQIMLALSECLAKHTVSYISGKLITRAWALGATFYKLVTHNGWARWSYLIFWCGYTAKSWPLESKERCKYSS